MTELTPKEKKGVKDFIYALPGKRGIDIPEHIYDQITPVADGIAHPLWGRPASPQQRQWLYDNGHHTPDKIHAAFNDLPHPHAPNLKVGEYQKYQEAYKVYKQGSGDK